MPLLTNISLLYQCRQSGGQEDVHPLPRAALAWEGETIRWVGPEAAVPAELAGLPREDAGGRVVIPGLVDCHTHLAFGGWRAEEFEQRIQGRSYLEIAAAGGGIASTVAQTRATPDEVLESRCLHHLVGMSRLGVTTVEAKTGYGLSVAEELRLLGIYRKVGARAFQRVVPTLLGAHMVPAELRARREDYISQVIEEMIPRAAAGRLARFCDVFVEESAFTVEEGRLILVAGKRHGLGAKVHADQLSPGGGAELAAELGAVSADHLERVSPEGIEALARSGVVAVSLPFASLYLGHPPLPARRLIEAGVPVAVATDFNPGTAPSYHLPFALTLACTLLRLTPKESLKGATAYAARAVGLQGEIGSLETGKSADFAVLDTESVEHWLYHLRDNACVRTVARGRDWTAVSCEQ